jgi:hypothetical protein
MQYKHELPRGGGGGKVGTNAPPELREKKKYEREENIPNTIINIKISHFVPIVPGRSVKMFPDGLT